MALIKCEECGSQMSDTADACPKCGAKATHTKPFTKNVAIGIGFFVALIIVGNVISSFTQKSAADVESARRAALTPDQRASEDAANKAAAEVKEREAANKAAAYACRDIVGKNLKDPESAKWEAPWHSAVKTSTDGKLFELQVAVRAKNGFGGYDKAHFNCTLSRNGDTWRALRLQEVR